MKNQILVYRHIADLKSRIEKDSISPIFLGNILEEMLRYVHWVHQSTGTHALWMDITSSDGDFFIAMGQTKHIRCKVFDVWEDVTDRVKAWSITRDSGDAVDDAAWGMKRKVKDFAGEIDIAFTREENDLGNAERTIYTVTAILTDNTAVAMEMTI